MDPEAYIQENFKDIKPYDTKARLPFTQALIVEYLEATWVCKPNGEARICPKLDDPGLRAMSSSDRREFFQKLAALIAGVMDPSFKRRMILSEVIDQANACEQKFKEKILAKKVLSEENDIKQTKEITDRIQQMTSEIAKNYGNPMRLLKIFDQHSTFFAETLAKINQSELKQTLQQQVNDFLDTIKPIMQQAQEDIKQTKEITDRIQQMISRIIENYSNPAQLHTILDQSSTFFAETLAKINQPELKQTLQQQVYGFLNAIKPTMQQVQSIENKSQKLFGKTRVKIAKSRLETLSKTLISNAQMLKRNILAIKDQQQLQTAATAKSSTTSSTTLIEESIHATSANTAKPAAESQSQRRSDFKPAANHQTTDKGYFQTATSGAATGAWAGAAFSGNPIGGIIGGAIGGIVGIISVAVSDLHKSKVQKSEKQPPINYSDTDRLEPWDDEEEVSAHESKSSIKVGA